jgi:hypothetical protein
VYPVPKLGVTLKSNCAIEVWKAVKHTPRKYQKRPEKPVAPLKPCQHCGVGLAKKKFCSNACRQAAYRLRPLSPAQVKEKAAQKQAGMEIRNAVCESQRKSSGGMEWDGRFSSVGPSNTYSEPTPAQKDLMVFPLGRALMFALDSVKEKVISNS